jgi:hypothetical protein
MYADGMFSSTWNGGAPAKVADKQLIASGTSYKVPDCIVEGTKVLMRALAFSMEVCTGKSANLMQAECTAWVSIFDKTGGPQWSHCSDSRLDPCNCSYFASDGGGRTGYTHHVVCASGSDGKHIEKM